MVKFFYKTLLISLISGPLTIIHLAAYAQDSQTSSPTPIATSALTRDENGVFKKTETYDFKGTQQKENMLNSITMLAVGAIGMGLITTHRKFTTDMMVAAVASAAYIGGEVVNIMNLKKQLKDTTIDITKSSDGKLDQAQIESLERLKASYKKAQKSGKTKKMFQLAAAAGFGGATAIAAFQIFSEKAALTGCQGGIAAALPQLGTCNGVEAEISSCAACAAELKNLQPIIAKYETARETPKPSALKVAEVTPQLTEIKMLVNKACPGATPTAIKTASLVPVCNAYIGTQESNNSSERIVTGANSVVFSNTFVEKLIFSNVQPKLEQKISVDSSLDFSSQTKGLLLKMFDSILGKAEAAGMTGMLGLGAGAIAAFAAAKLGLEEVIDNYIFSPIGRTVIWGVLAGAAFMASRATQAEIDKITENIKRIDQLLHEMNTLKSGVKVNNITEQQLNPTAFQINQNQDIPLNSDTDAKVSTDCLGSSGSSNCTSLANTITSMPGFSTLPDSFKSIASQSAQLGDGLSGTSSISSSTLTTAGAFANKQAAIAKLANSLKKKVNDGLIKSGKPKIDFDKQEKAFLDRMTGQTSRALSSSGLTPNSFLASTGVGPISSTNKEIIPSSKNGSSGIQGLGGAPGSTSKSHDLNLDLKENIGNIESTKLEDESLDSDKDATNGKFDIGTNDINTNGSESIFKVISDRYIKSGYPRLLEEIPAKK